MRVAEETLADSSLAVATQSRAPFCRAVPHSGLKRSPVGVALSRLHGLGIDNSSSMFRKTIQIFGLVSGETSLVSVCRAIQCCASYKNQTKAEEQKCHKADDSKDLHIIRGFLCLYSGSTGSGDALTGHHGRSFWKRSGTFVRVPIPTTISSAVLPD